MAAEGPLAGGYFRPSVAAILVSPDLRAVVSGVEQAAGLLVRRTRRPTREVAAVFLGHLAFVIASVEGFPLAELLREVTEVAQHLATGSAAYEAEQAQRKGRPS